MPEQTEQMTFIYGGNQYSVTIPVGLSDIEAYDWAMKNKPKFAALNLPRPKGDDLAKETKSTLPADLKIKAAPKPFSKGWWKELMYKLADPGTKAFPAVGATMGGIIGGGAGAAGTLGTASVPGAIGGAYVGGMGGEAAKQILRRLFFGEGPQTTEEAARNIAKEGAVQGAVQAGAEALPFLAGPLRKAAVGQYERALAPTGQYMKATTSDIVPGLLERREVGSLESLKRRATERAAEINPELTQGYGTLETGLPKLPVRGAGGRFRRGTVGQIPGAGRDILRELDGLKSKYMVKDAVGNLHPGSEHAVTAIEGVKDIVKKLGQNVPPSSLRQLKHIFDEPVAEAGGYAGAELATHYTLNAQEVAANSIRKILHDASPNISALDREISFWLDVKLVTSRTIERQIGQAGGLVKVVGPVATGLAAELGYHSGGAARGVEAGVGTALVVLATKMIRSPQWRTASAVFKDRMARSLASGNVGELSALATRLGIAALPSDRRKEEVGAR